MLGAVDLISGKFSLVNYSQTHPDSCNCLLPSCFFMESQRFGELSTGKGRICSNGGFVV